MSVSRLHLQTHERAFPSAVDPLFEVAAVFVDGVFDGPGGSVAEAADRRAGDDAHTGDGFRHSVEVRSAGLNGGCPGPRTQSNVTVDSRTANRMR